tara:strand:+ start:491 stop:787 length:297 start_codon:yes stop_codon:yes gene_type:complete
MIHIDNLDGEGTIFMSTDDGTQSIGHVEKEYASILQDVLKSYDWYVEEVKRLREESKKKGNVLSTLDEMIRNEESHVEMMKALEQGLDLPETWKEMIE